MPESKSGAGRGRLFAVLRIVIALAILAFVALNLDWRDRLVYGDGTGAQSAVEGEIHGDWKGSRIAFQVDPDTEIPEALPAEVREALAVGQRVELERGGDRAGEAGFQWKPGMPRIFAEIDTRGLVQALGLLLVGILLVVTRWWRLLAVAGCPTSWFNALRLSFLGLFFNSVVPGLTGGDLVKGVIAAKENPGRRADAIMSVVVDRVLGLVALAGLAAVVIVFSGDTFAEIRLPVVAFIVLSVVGALAYAAPALRRLLRVDAILERLPLGDKLRKLDQAALLYFRHPLELGLGLGISLVNHFMVITACFVLGRAFGVAEAVAGYSDFLVVIPVGNIISALPIAPMGWGLGEFIYKALFEMIEVDGALGVATSVTFRLCLTLFGLVGGIYLLLPGAKAEVREVREAQG